MDIEISGSYFNATKLLSKRNQEIDDYNGAKRQYNFKTCAKYQGVFAKIQDPFVMTGKGREKTTWMDMRLLPLYLAWLAPEYYLPFANHQFKDYYGNQDVS